MRRISLLPTLLILMLLSACGPSPHHESRNLAPGNSDYPPLNSAPTYAIEFTAVVPPTISSEFHLQYSVDLDTTYLGHGLYSTAAPHGCHWTEEAPFNIDLTLTLTKNGNTYKGRIIRDLFLPGACDWHLSGITNPSYNENTSNHGMYRPILLDDLSPNTRNPYPEPDTVQNIYIWCTRHSWTPFPNKHSELWCSSLDAIQSNVSNMPVEFVKSVPANERNWDMILSPSLKSLTIRFIDLDSSMKITPRQGTTEN